MNVAVTLSGIPSNHPTLSQQTPEFTADHILLLGLLLGTKIRFQESFINNLPFHLPSQSVVLLRPRRRLLPCPVRIPSDPLITDDEDSLGRVPLHQERVLITPESWNNLTAVDVVRSWAHQKFINEIIRKNILPLRGSLESL